MKRLLLISILVLGNTGCSFISKRLESREKNETLDSHQKSIGNSDEQLIQIRIRDLERQLNTQRDKELYSKLLPWFSSEEEKLEYLLLDSLQEKQEWAQNEKVWTRAKKPNDEMKILMQNQDIAIGMPLDYVIKSWGEPLSKEVSGNPLFKNQKWRYSRSISTQEGFKQEKRIVYFEGGKVVGWETD